MTDTEALWAAVDAISRPTTRRVMRDADPDWLGELGTLSNGFCDVNAYRAATVSHGTIPSLWEQAEMALTTGAESASGNPSPLAQRSPADMDLMEIMLTIREVIGLQLGSTKLAPRKELCSQLRQFASHIVTSEPEHVAWWEYRIAQWARLLAVYLRNVESQPKPVRLRDTACPDCGVKQVRVEIEDVWQLVPPLLIDFKDGYIRAAECTNCTKTWWRGEDLFELAEQIAYAKKPSDEQEMTG